MLNGLDLFSGIGGIALALAPWVRPVAYCEIDRYAVSVLFSRMADGSLPRAPIWDDVRTLGMSELRAHGHGDVDIITGGFPCQDISVAGTGAGLAGERSGLFFEIARLCGELRPAFVFLENVPAITTRGGREVVGTFAALGYDCRWCVISAASVGANHRRERWFLLAHAQGERKRKQANQAEPITIGRQTRDESGNSGAYVANTHGAGREELNTPDLVARSGHDPRRIASIWGREWWTVEPGVGRVAHGIPHRVDRVKCCGNAVVPLQARTAFEILSGFRREGV